MTHTIWSQTGTQHETFYKRFFIRISSKLVIGYSSICLNDEPVFSSLWSVEFILEIYIILS